MFSNLGADQLTGKIRQAFSSGFLGLASFGWSTLVRVGEMPDEDYATLANSLALHFVARYGAPDMKSALTAAMVELDFASNLCDRPLDSIIAVHRTLEDDGIHEEFRVVASDTPVPAHENPAG